MQPSSRLIVALAGIALATGIACGESDNGDLDFTPGPTTTPYFAGTNTIPTPAPGFEGSENLPVPTFTGQPTVTASGLQIYEILAGGGAEATAGSFAYVTYTLWVQGGNMVDRTRLGPVPYRLSQGQTIDGLIEGLVGMRIGGHRILIIPPALAYGSQGSGNVIPPNATLIYDIKMTTAQGEPTSTPTAEPTATSVP